MSTVGELMQWQTISIIFKLYKWLGRVQAHKFVLTLASEVFKTQLCDVDCKADWQFKFSAKIKKT
jgi:hypothetical protein